MRTSRPARLAAAESTARVRSTQVTRPPQRLTTSANPPHPATHVEHGAVAHVPGVRPVYRRKVSSESETVSVSSWVRLWTVHSNPKLEAYCSASTNRGIPRSTATRLPHAVQVSASAAASNTSPHVQTRSPCSGTRGFLSGTVEGAFFRPVIVPRAVSCGKGGRARGGHSAASTRSRGALADREGEAVAGGHYVPTRWVIAVLVLVLGCLSSAPAQAAEDADRQRLLALFTKLQDVLLTINSEILQNGERLQDVSSRLRDRTLWEHGELDQQRLVPALRELNRLKSAMALIGTGLETRYAQVRALQGELRERYPTQSDIDTYYAMFDRVYESSRERQRRTTAQMAELKRWFKTQVASRSPESDEEEEAPTQVVQRPRRARR